MCCRHLLAAADWAADALAITVHQLAEGQPRKRKLAAAEAIVRTGAADTLLRYLLREDAFAVQSGGTALCSPGRQRTCCKTWSCMTCCVDMSGCSNKVGPYPSITLSVQHDEEERIMPIHRCTACCGKARMPWSHECVMLFALFC